MAKILIALDDGHGMHTPGKRSPMMSDGTVMLENEFNRRVVAYLDKELKRCGFATILVAPTDEDVSLGERVNRANRAKANFYLSIHANAFNSKLDYKAGGIETFAHFSYPKTVEKAKIIHKWVMKGSKMKDRGVKNGDWLYVCKNTAMESVLTELGFMDNIDDLKLLMSDAYRKECAVELAQALCEIYKMNYVPEQSNKGVVNVPKKDDIKGTWGESSIRKAIDKGIIPGYSDGSWQPNRPITRADMAVILDRLGLLK